MPTKPISASAGHEVRGGSGDAPRSDTMASNNAVPSANRVKMSVTGEISRNAALVATNEMPQSTIARSAATRGESVLFKRFLLTWQVLQGERFGAKRFESIL